MLKRKQLASSLILIQFQPRGECVLHTTTGSSKVIGSAQQQDSLQDHVSWLNVLMEVYRVADTGPQFCATIEDELQCKIPELWDSGRYPGMLIRKSILLIRRTFVIIHKAGVIVNFLHHLCFMSGSLDEGVVLILMKT